MGCGFSTSSTITPLQILVAPKQRLPGLDTGDKPPVADKDYVEPSVPGSLSLGSRSTCSGTVIRRKVANAQCLYRFQEQVGIGASGYVMRAQSRANDQACAIKIVSNELIDAHDLGFEADILGMIDHPNVIRLFECLEDDSKTYLVTELCEGGELLRRVEWTDGLAEREVGIVMKQIWGVLEHMHSIRICHRDVKTENFMFESRSKSIEDNVLKAVDFGLACIFHPGEFMMKKVGTLFYLAPEVIRERYDNMCDMWSCGCVMYLLCSGALPFNGNTDEEVQKKVLKGRHWFPARKWENVSMEAKDIISSMLNPKPNERCSPEQALALPWLDKHVPYRLRAQCVASCRRSVEVVPDDVEEVPLIDLQETKQSFNHTSDRPRTATDFLV